MLQIDEAIALSLFDHCDKECDTKRKYMLPIWKRAEFYWNDIQDLFWREDIWDWRTFEDEEGESEINAIKDNNKIINVYRAYGESIIAAATTGNLTFRFFPSNADEPLDLDKSQSFTDKADYIQRVNRIKELRRKAFVIRWNQGLVASYTFYEKDKRKYGSYKKEIIDTRKKLIKSTSCPNPECDYEAPTQALETPDDFANEAQTSIPPVEPGTLPPLALEPNLGADNLCPNCNGPLTIDESIEETPYVAGEEDVERGCSTINIYSPLQFKVPFYATKPSEVNYVILEAETHYSTARTLFPDFADKINAGSVNPVEAEERNQADLYAYSSLSSSNLVTIKQLWAKPSMYNVLAKEFDSSIDSIIKGFPEGVHIIKVGNVIVFAANVDMDRHWTFVESAMDTHVYLRALGNAIIPIQDMENDLVYMTMDTIRHQPGEVFYDSRVINAKTYDRQMARAGNRYPINVVDSKRPIGEYFHDVPGATLSQQVDLFHERLESRAQLVSGAFPSIYGGQFQGGSKTLGVYEQSRANALQRVTIPADGIDEFLAATVHKATVLYDENMEDDETITVEDGGGFKNVTLTKSATGGKIARVEIVKSEQFPTTWEQKRAFVMELFDKNLEPLNATVFASENITTMGRIIGIPELKVPGDADRNKQLHVIQKLIKAAPIPPQIDPQQLAASGIDINQLDPNNLPPGFDPSMLEPKPSIEPDYDVDNHQVCLATSIAWAVSREGILTKERNPEGYQNVILNLRAHKMILDQQAMTQAQPQPGAKPPAPKEQSNAAR